MSHLMKRTMLGLAAIAMGLGAASTAAAQSQCGVTGSTVTSLGNYDPFNPTAITSVNTTIRLTRVASGAKKTQQVNFHFIKPSGSPDYQILYQGTNVYRPAGSAPLLTLQSSQVAGIVNHNFGGAGQAESDTVDLPFTITIPQGVDLTAGEPIRFDILYVCSGTGPQFNSVTSPTTLTNAITLTLNVFSALQASYVGPALNFGEIGDKDLAEVSVPAMVRTGNIRVASSGPYQVAMTSLYDFNLKNTGTDLIPYQVTMLGQSARTGVAYPTQACARAGIGGVYIPISAQLLQGGEDKPPAPLYSDTISVTITPRLTSDLPTAPACGGTL